MSYSNRHNKIICSASRTTYEAYWFEALILEVKVLNSDVKMEVLVRIMCK